MHFRTSRRARLRALTAVAGLAAAVTATITAPPAQSAPPSEPVACPDAVPDADLTGLIGQDVTGFTVSSGNTPEEITGKVDGVLANGIAPGIPLIIIDFSGSPAIDKAGIWAGMSGSPVYADDGRLIGAVSYSLTWATSPVAGVTPAADMQALLGGGAAAAAKSPARQVTLPQRMQQRLVSDGLATQTEATTMSQLPLPLAVSGSRSISRMSAAEKNRMRGPRLLNRPDVLLYKSGSAPAVSPGSDEISAGSNLTASVSYGDITFAGIGTTTMVCDGQAVGFGHPMLWTGDSTMTMNGADAITVLKDDIGGSYKLANVTGPVGAITGDHLVGISGPVGADDIPASTLVESNVTDVSTLKQRTGDTYVSVPDYLAEVALFAEVDNQDVVFDRIGKGSALVHFTVEGTADGEPFTLVRTNRFASSYDISFDTIWEMYEDIYRLLHNRFADVTIGAVHITTQIDPTYRAYKVGKVERKVGTGYVTLSRRSIVHARPGSTLTLRVTLNSDALGTKVETVKVKVPYAPIGAFGELSVGRLRLSGSSANSFDDLVSNLSNAPRNDELSAALRLFIKKRSTGLTSSASTPAGDVISGGHSFYVRISR